MKLAPISRKIEQVIIATPADLRWHQDKPGYFLIRLNRTKIEVGFCTPNHVITKKIVGRNATEIYYAIINRKLLTRLEHAAYLGKELTKAEFCLKQGKKYVQDEELI